MSGYDENPGIVVAQQINNEPDSAVSVALKAALGSSTVGNRLRRAAHSSTRKDGLLPVITTPPTITTSASNLDGTLTNAYRVSTGQAAVFRFVGAIQIPTLYTGVFQTLYDVTMPSGSGGNTSGHGSTGTYGWAVEFYSDAPKVMLRTLNTVNYMVEVNDQPLSASPLIQAGPGGTQYMALDFTSAGGSAVRKFRVEFAFASAWDGVYVDPTYAVWAPTSETNLRVASVGDSVCQATGATFPNGGWQDVAAKVLGWVDVRQVAFGGSGFTVAGSGNTFIAAQRVADVVAHNPDLLVISASGNDNSQPGIQAAALATFRAYRAALPKVPIVVMGVDTYRGTTTSLATQQATETAVKAAGFDQWADANSWWIPVTLDPVGPWQTGSGHVGATTGDGVADRYSVDGTHPNDAGHQYLGYRFAQAFRSSVLPNVP